MTIKEIAKLAGVSRGTVDRVLNKRGGVRIETQEKIQQIIETTNYSPNIAGKNLAAKKKRLRFAYIAMKPIDSNVAFVPPGFQEERKRLAEFGVEVILKEFGPLDYVEEVQVLEELKELEVDGIALVPLSHPSVVEKIRELTSAGMPIVTYGSDLKDCGRLAYVGIDHYKCGRMAAQLIHLITKGPASICIIGNEDDSLNSRATRTRGFFDKLSESYPEIQIAESLRIPNDEFECYAAVKSLIERRPDMDAIFVNAASLSYGACRALRTSKRHIPSVVYVTTNQIEPYVKDESIDVMIRNYSMSQGSLPLEILYNYLTMGTVPPEGKINTNSKIAISENL